MLFCSFGVIVSQTEVCNPAAEPANCTLQEVKGPEKRGGTGSGGHTVSEGIFLSVAHKASLSEGLPTGLTVLCLHVFALVWEGKKLKVFLSK